MCAIPHRSRRISTGCERPGIRSVVGPGACADGATDPLTTRSAMASVRMIGVMAISTETGHGDAEARRDGVLQLKIVRVYVPPCPVSRAPLRPCRDGACVLLSSRAGGACPPHAHLETDRCTQH